MTDWQPGDPLSDRRREILRAAAELVATDGYPALTMRAVARTSGMKLGALQYHFSTSDKLLRGLATFVSETYRAGFDEFRENLANQPSVADLVRFLSVDAPGQDLDADRLFPQLWAMSLVEPIIEELIDDLYAEYLGELTNALDSLGVNDPQAEAIVVMSMLDGLTLFVGNGRRWEKHDRQTGNVIFDIIEQRYGGGMSTTT